MEACSVAEEQGRRREPLRWRLWALVLIVLLVAVVSLFAREAIRCSTWSAETASRRPVRRAPSGVLARGDPDPRDGRTSARISIATVTVDDAIVPYTVDGPTTSSGCARRRSSCPTRGPGRADLGRDHQLHRDPDHRRDRRGGRDTPAEPRAGSSDTRSSERSSASFRSRSAALAAVASTGSPRVAGGVHGLPEACSPSWPSKRFRKPWLQAAPRGTRRHRAGRARRGSELPRAALPLAAAWTKEPPKEARSAGSPSRCSWPWVSASTTSAKDPPWGLLRSRRAHARHVPHRRVHAPQRHGGPRDRRTRCRG